MISKKGTQFHYTILFLMYLASVIASEPIFGANSKQKTDAFEKQANFSKIQQQEFEHSPLIGIVEEDLEFKIYLDDDDDRKSINRYARIINSQPITVMQTSVMVQTVHNTEATLTVGVQLYYQAKSHDRKMLDKTGLTLVSSRFVDHGAGLQWSGEIIDCKNSDCSEYKQIQRPEVEKILEIHEVPAKKWHQLGVLWDEDTEEFVFSYNQVKNG